jgi:hypothetical protein
MTEAVYKPAEQNQPGAIRKSLRWLGGIFFTPGRVFAEMAEENRSVWLPPLLLLSVVVLLGVASSGSVKHANAMTGEISLPQDFQYYPPEMQERFMQATQATSSSTFLYVLPALLRVSGVWVLWLIMAGLLHLILTMFGSRAAGGMILNVAAWASVPLAVKEVVRFFYVLISRRLILNLGLSGFAPSGTGNLALLLGAAFALVDVYLLWQIALVVAGTKASSGLSFVKNLSAVLLTFVVLTGLQTLVVFGPAKLGIALIGSPIML